MKHKFFITLALLLTITSGFAVYRISEFQPFPKENILLNGAVTAKYTFTASESDPPFKSGSVLGSLPAGLTYTTDCKNDTRTCSVEFTFSPHTVTTINLKPKFQLNLSSITANDSQKLQAISTNTPNVTLAKTVIFQPDKISATYNFTNNEISFPSLNSINLTQPGLTIFSNTCANITYQQSCKIEVVLNTTEGFPILHPEISLAYDIYQYHLSDTPTINAGFFESILVDNTNWYFLTKNTSGDINKSNQQLAISPNMGGTWQKLTLNFSDVVDPTIAPQPSFSNTMIVKDELYGVASWQNRSAIVSKNITSDNNFVSLFSTIDNIYNFNFYQDKNKQNYLLISSGNSIYAKNLSNPQTDWFKVYVYSSIPGSIYPGTFSAGQILISQADSKLYYFVASYSYNVNHLAVLQFDLSDGVKESMNPQGKDSRTPFILLIDYNNTTLPFGVRQGTNIYVRTYGGGIMKKEGNDFVNVNLPGNFLAAGVSTNDSDLFLMTTDAQHPLYKTNDAGKTWEEMTPPAGAKYPYQSITASPKFLQIVDQDKNVFYLTLANNKS